MFKIKWVFFAPFLFFVIQCRTTVRQAEDLDDSISHGSFSSLASSEYCNAKRETNRIPRIIHQVWHDWGKGKDKLPPKFKQMAEDLKNTHPNWKYKLWKTKNSRAFIKKRFPKFLKVYDSYDNPKQRSNAIRYFVLEHFGGLYLDSDMVALKKVDSLLQGCDLVFGEDFGESRIIDNDFMASIPRHPFWKEVRHKLRKTQNLKSLEESTGKVFLTDMIHRYTINRLTPFVKVYTNVYVHPFDQGRTHSREAKACASSLEQCKKLFPDTYLVRIQTKS